MRYRNHTRIFFTLLTALCLLAAHGALAASLKARMLARNSAITALKDQGIIGEDNQGYLQYRTENKPQKNLITAENKDRAEAYAQISKEQGVGIDLILRHRAQQIAEKGTPGHWYQRPDGVWYKK